MFRLTFLITLFLWASLAFAELQFTVWKPKGFKYPYIVPVREGETPEHAIARYQAAVNMNQDLQTNLFSHKLNLPVGKPKDFALEEDGPRALIVANKEDDMARAQEFIRNAADPMKSRGVKPYVLPLDAHLGLSIAEADEMRELLKKQFDLGQGIGGDDWTPQRYGQQVTYARPPMSAARDIPELKLWKEFADGKTGPFINLYCRSHQGMGICGGEKLVQDIPEKFGIDYHQDGNHKIIIDRESSEHLAKIFPGVDEMTVNSLHHQSISMAEGVNENELFRVVARDPHGIVEAIELKNGRGIGVQFHPELMGGKKHKAYMDYIADQAHLAYRRRVKGKSCDRKFAEIKKDE